jgi:hypothetical protein
MACERGAEGFEAGLSFGVGDGGGWCKGFVGFADGELVGQHGDADVPEDGAEVD